MADLNLTASDGHKLNAYLAEPQGTPTAGIVVIQEIFGVNTHIREDADRFAAAGYLAIAPAMFDRVKRDVSLGYDADTIAAGRDIAMALQPAGIMTDVLAAAAELRSRGCTRVGIVGYCFGGTVSATAACHLAEAFDCAVAYYGGGVDGIVKSGATPSIPLILHFGLRDPYIPIDVIDNVAETWTASPVYRYDANHGFHCDHRADYDQPASDQAQERTLAFFAQHLG
jgi:carboxymethylenebutenolidase